MTYPNDCCNEEGNLVETQEDDNLTVRKCSVCGCKHYEFTVDPGELGLVGEAL